MPNVRTLEGSLTIPVRITESKTLEDIANKMIDYSFFDNSKLPQVPKTFQVETGFYKTASGYLVPPGEYDYEYNKDIIQILVDKCITSSLSVSSEQGSPTTMSIGFNGTIDKNPRTIINTDASTLSAVKSSFDINRVLGYQDNKFILNGSLVPNVTKMEFSIKKTIVEERFSRSAEASVNIGSYFPVSNILEYSNDLPSKIGVQDFQVTLTVEQVLRRIDEDLYLSRAGVGQNEYSGENFLDAYFGPIKISRTCSLVNQSEQPYGVGKLKRTTTFLLLTKPRVFKGDYVQIVSTGVW
jgi:hypothetical protein